MKEPETIAGRTLWANLIADVDSQEQSRKAILAIEDEARAAALDGLNGDEAIGECIHAAVHPAHEWSACSNPDLVYTWVTRFLAAIDALRERSGE